MLLAFAAPWTANAQSNTLLTEGFENMTSPSSSYSATDWYYYNANSGYSWELNSQYVNNGSKSVLKRSFLIGLQTVIWSQNRLM